jgi:acetyl-CoA carboxylase carboxyl transferase subunit beta
VENFFEDRKKRLELFHKQVRGKQYSNPKLEIPSGLFIKCDKCNEHLYSEDISVNHFVCPKCRYHFRIPARYRIKITADEGSFEEMFTDLVTVNPLDFPGYPEKIAHYQAETFESEAVVTGTASIKGIKIALGILDSFFMMGSMGSVVGEKITRLIEYATAEKLPLIIFSASGGARMQEGIFSLMQMAKTAAALKRFSEKGLLYISVLTNPTTGGVAASFSSLGDIIIAEKDSLIGFAGQRVIKNTINQALPEGFQTDTFQLRHGMVDLILDRIDLKDKLYQILLLHQGSDEFGTSK